MIILYRMASLVLVTTLVGILLSSIWLVVVNGSRADLGTYLHIKELPGAEEKIAVDSYVLAYINYTYNTTDGKEAHFSEEKARYGEGRIMNVQGHLVHVTSEKDTNDHTGCWPPLRGTKGNPLPGPGKPWIALIKRGMCTFEEKIKNAWRQRAVGVIVYNEESSVSLEKMRINEKDRNITAVFTYKYIGEEMARIVEQGHAVWLSITEGQRGVKPMTNINKTSVLFVSISFIVLMIISLVWLIFYYVQRFRYLQSKDQHSRHLCTVAKRIIMKIPTKSGKCEEKDSDSDCCAICIEPYKPTDCIRVLPCNHEFHKNCIDPWLLEHRTCPMCKLDVLKHYGFVFIGSQESILQLDLDMEINGDGLHSSEDDRLSGDNMRISTTPTFHIQNFNTHGHVRRGSSLESLSALQREASGRSRSSLSHPNPVLDESITSKLKIQQALSDKSQNTSRTSDSKLLCPSSFRKEVESVSLPGTLRKKRCTSDSLRGSNNCYVKTTADLKLLAAKIEKGCPKSRTVLVRQASDDKLLLAGEKTEIDIDSADLLYANIKIQIDDVDEHI